LTIRTAILVRVVADCVILELAGRCITASIVATRLDATAVTFFSLFDDPIATLTAADGNDSTICCQAIGLDAVSSESRADIAYGTGAEISDTGTCRRIHNVSALGITSGAAQRTALLSIDCGSVRTGGTVAIVDGSKDMTTFVSTKSAKLPIFEVLNLRHNLPLG
jgi:hypothetical protein